MYQSINKTTSQPQRSQSPIQTLAILNSLTHMSSKTTKTNNKYQIKPKLTEKTRQNSNPNLPIRPLQKTSRSTYLRPRSSEVRKLTKTNDGLSYIVHNTTRFGARLRTHKMWTQLKAASHRIVRKKQAYNADISPGPNHRVISYHRYLRWWYSTMVGTVLEISMALFMPPCLIFLPTF